MKKILLIEDNVDLAENISELLEKDGYNVQTVFTGEEGLKSVIDFKPDLILCDILLPDINGYTILKQLKKMEGLVLPIFIFITAKSQREDLRKGMVLGAEDYLTKPFTYEELLAAIKVQLQKRTKAFKDANHNSKEMKESDSSEKQIFQKLRQTDKSETDYSEYVFLKSKKDSGFYLIDDIVVIKSLKDYTNLFLKGEKSFIIHRSMIDWEKKLPGKKFIRIHKQTMINLKYVEKVELISSNRFLISLNFYPKKLEVSQRYSRKLKKLYQ